MLRGLLIAGLLCLGVWATADDLKSPEPVRGVGSPYDWTHRHVVFSQPQTFERLREIQSEPRYWHQVYRSLLAVHAPPPRQVPNPKFTPDWGMSLGTTSMSFNNLVSYPAKYSFNASNPTPSCTNDYVVFTLPTSAANTINLIAFNNLYVNNSGTGTCSGTLPNAIFAYNASQNNGPLNSSPVLSMDGTQIAFVEDAGMAQFHVLKWASGNVSATFGSPFNSSALANCATNGAVAPCEYSVTYSSHTATLSAPYVDYNSDTAYVTDDNGNVSAITPVFGGGTPAVKSGYPLAVIGSMNMTPPVYDSVSKNVFIADKKGNLYYIRTASSTTGTCLSGSPPCVGATTLNVASNSPVYEAPMLDSSSGKVFVFSNNSPTNNNASVVQASTTLGSSVVATIGQKGSENVYAGAFNNAYFNSPGTGLLYACGDGPMGPMGNVPQLYAISFTGTTMNSGAAAHGPLALATGNANCLSMTEVYNQGSTSTDLLYVGVTTMCSASITGGCVQSFNITSGFPSAYNNIAAETGGTTGIIVDNVVNGSSTASQANIYFISQGNQSCTKYTSGGGTNATGNCAIKLTQTGLQ